MNVKCFYGSKSKLNHAPIKLPAQNPEISDDSDLFTDSDEELNPELYYNSDLCSDTVEEIILPDTEDEVWDDQSDKIDFQLTEHKKNWQKTTEVRFGMDEKESRQYSKKTSSVSG